MSISVVVPIYNERENVVRLYDAACSVLEKIGRPFEIILVNDGSNDGSTELLEQLARKDERVRIIEFRRNFGQTAAMSAGMQAASGEIVVTLDADLQNDPSDIPMMIEKLEEGYDLVQGWRKDRKDPFLSRRLPSHIANWLISKVTRFPIHDLGCTLKAMRRDIAHELRLYGEMHRFIPILAHWRGARCAEVVTGHFPREFGTSKYGISRTLRVVFDLITVKYLIRYLVSPMKLFGAIGLICGIVGIVSGLATIGMKVFQQVDMTGNPLLLLAALSSMLGVHTTLRLAALFAVVAGVVLFHELGDFRSLGSHEVYATVPAREMLQSGNWIVPRYGGLPRLRKPPLAYWVLASTATVFGEFNEWVVRVPAAVSALLLSILIGCWAGRWYGRVAGWAAAFAQLTAVWVLIFSRKAEVDMLLCLLTTTAMFLVANQPGDESRRKQFLRWSGIWALLSASWLAKFHYGPAMVIAPCGLYFLIQKRFRGIWNFVNPLGLLLFAAAVFVWPYLLLQQIPDAWAVWRTETVGRAVGAMGHKPFWFYVPHLLWLTLPWTPFAIAAVPQSWRRAWKEADAHERFLWIWLLTQFAIVTISANKHKHYLNTAFPMASLLAAQSLSRLVARIRRGEWQFSRRAMWTGSAAAIATGGVIVAIGRHKWPHLTAPFVAIGVIIAAGGIVTHCLAYFRRPALTGVTAGLAFLGCYAIANAWIVPERDHRLAVAYFARETRAELSPDLPIAVYRMGETSVVYYLETPVQRSESQPTLAKQLAEQNRLYVVTYASLASEVVATGRGRIVRQMTDRPGIPRPKHEPLVLVELTKTEATADIAQTAGAIATREHDTLRR
eukprot:g8306.t1